MSYGGFRFPTGRWFHSARFFPGFVRAKKKKTKCRRSKHFLERCWRWWRRRGPRQGRFFFFSEISPEPSTVQKKRKKCFSSKRAVGMLFFFARTEGDNIVFSPMTMRQSSRSLRSDRSPISLSLSVSLSVSLCVVFSRCAIPDAGFARRNTSISLACVTAALPERPPSS